MLEEDIGQRDSGEYKCKERTSKFLTILIETNFRQISASVRHHYGSIHTWILTQKEEGIENKVLVKHFGNYIP